MPQRKDQDAAEDLGALLRGAQAGDPAAWREIVGRYGRRLFALAKSRCRDADMAEEIAQSVLATVALKMGSGEYAEQGRFESWLFRVAMNRIRDHVRRLKRSPITPGQDAALEQAAARRSEGSEEQELESLRRAIAQLPEQDREIIELRHHGEMSFKQIADVLDEPLGTLLARHHRALKKLREMLEKTEPGRRERAEVER